MRQARHLQAAGGRLTESPMRVIFNALSSHRLRTGVGSFASCAEEIAWSRIYGGIHFYSADIDGLTAGRQIGEYVMNGFLKPLPEHARLTMARSGEVNLSGTPGQNYVVETSTNLIQWAPVITNAAPFSLLPSAGAATRFYRAIAAD